MNRPTHTKRMPWLGIAFFLLTAQTGFAQYGGMGGGYGGGGYGSRGYGYGGMNQGIPQTPSTPPIPNIAGDMANREIKYMEDNLTDLSKDQTKSIKKLYRDYATQQQDAIKDILRNKGGKPAPDDVKSIQQMMMMLNEEKEEALKPILTPEQWTLYQSKKEDMQAKIGGIRPPAEGKARPLPKQ